MWRVALLAIAVITGVAISAATVRRNFYPMRSGVVVDPSSQVNVIKQAPLRYARIVTSDYIGHGHEYLRQFVGTLGWLDVPLPHWLTDVAVVLLLLLGVTQRLDLRMRDRLALAVVALLSLAMVSTSQYLAWSMVGGDQISGIQGRYFLPLAPALLLLFVTPKLASWSRFVRPLYFTTLTVANVTAIVFLLQRYY
jgi:uncharacterized membrane protein